MLRGVQAALYDENQPHKDGNYASFHQKVGLNEIGFDEVIDVIRDKVKKVAQDHQQEYALFLGKDFAHDFSPKIEVDIFDHVISQFERFCPKENPAKADKMEGEDYT